MHADALRAAREAMQAVKLNGQRQRFSDEYADLMFVAGLAAFLAKAHENTDPDETARYCLLAQLRKEIA